jgi:hypothetical protein
VKLIEKVERNFALNVGDKSMKNSSQSSTLFVRTVRKKTKKQPIKKALFEKNVFVRTADQKQLCSVRIRFLLLVGS